MKIKIYDIWNFEEIIEEKIKKFGLSDNFFSKDEKYIFKSKSYCLKISEEEIVLNNKVYNRDSNIKIKKEKSFFKRKLYVDSVLIDENEEFVESILEEWREINTTLVETEEKHILVGLKQELKEEYLRLLDSILENLSPLKIRKDKYIFSFGRSLDIEERKIINLLKKRQENILEKKQLDKDYYIFLINDVVNFFHKNLLEYPKFQMLIKDFGELENEKIHYKILVDFLEKENKNGNKIRKQLEKEQLNSYYKIKLQNIFHNNINTIWKTKERENMSQELKIEFVRDGQEYYYYKFIGNANATRLEYLEGLEEETNVILKYVNNLEKLEDSEELEFNEVLNAKKDAAVEEELTKKSSLYKKQLRDKNIIKTGEFHFPKITYADITEEIILGYLRIKKEPLNTSGIWGYQGRRWLEISFENLKSELENKDNLSLNYNFKLEHYRNTAVEDILDITELSTNYEDKENTTNDLIIKFPIDTNYLGKEYIKEKDESYVNLDFNFELEIVDNDLEQKYILGAPLRIKLLNPEHKDYNSKEIAAIDFGTSSSCIAINNSSAQRVLISLEEPDKRGKQAYENPTNLLIKDWKEFYKNWKNREVEIPIIEKYEDIHSSGLYNQGHGLKEQLRGEASKAELNAQVTQLKLVPYKTLTLKDKVKLVPYHIPKVGIKEVELVADYNGQNEEKFDIISFYGYILGRAILSPVNEKIFKKFYVTVPVKFETDVKNSIINSLKNGIKLAIPEPLKDEIVVEEGYEEPVAFIGAVCSHNELEDWKINSNFAVFDFGGGTLDFAFGKYREANEEVEEEIDNYDRIVEIINTSGDEKGGAEYMIHKLSYELYKWNQDEMKEKRIPFIIPTGEAEIELFPQELQRGKTREAVLNVNTINENISRRIFENEDYEKTLELRNEDGNIETIEISIEKEFLESILKGLISKQVENFKTLIEESFTGEKDIYKNLHIFRGGNASRSKLLEKILKDNFPESKIHFVDEESVHGLKPKTAVALGELKLRSSNEIGVVFNNRVDNDEVPFEFNVGYPNLDKDNEFIEHIKIGSTDKKWKKLCRANKESLEFAVYYTKSLGVTELNNANIKIHRQSVAEENLKNGNIVWIRAVNANKLEYILSRKEPQEEEKGEVLALPRY